MFRQQQQQQNPYTQSQLSDRLYYLLSVKLQTQNQAQSNDIVFLNSVNHQTKALNMKLK